MTIPCAPATEGEYQTQNALFLHAQDAGGGGGHKVWNLGGWSKIFSKEAGMFFFSNNWFELESKFHLRGGLCIQGGPCGVSQVLRPPGLKKDAN